jgi:hypothetical protein
MLDDGWRKQLVIWFNLVSSHARDQRVMYVFLFYCEAYYTLHIQQEDNG